MVRVYSVIVEDNKIILPRRLSWLNGREVRVIYSGRKIIIEPKITKRQLTHEELEIIKKDYEEGKSLVETARRLNRSYWTIWTAINRLIKNGEVRKRKINKPYTKKEDSFIIKNYERMKIEEIAKVLGRSKRSVENRIRKLREEGLIGRKTRALTNEEKIKIFEMLKEKSLYHIANELGVKQPTVFTFVYRTLEKPGLMAFFEVEKSERFYCDVCDTLNEGNSLMVRFVEKGTRVKYRVCSYECLRTLSMKKGIMILKLNSQKRKEIKYIKKSRNDARLVLIPKVVLDEERYEKFLNQLKTNLKSSKSTIVRRINEKNIMLANG